MSILKLDHDEHTMGFHITLTCYKRYVNVLGGGLLVEEMFSRLCLCMCVRVCLLCCQASSILPQVSSSIRCHTQIV